MCGAVADLNDLEKLSRRRTLASGRQNREAERIALLAQLIQTEREATELRNWITLQEANREARSPELQRFLAWARTALSSKEQFLAPAAITQLLHTRNLFPEMDELADPLGDPPPLRAFGR